MSQGLTALEDNEGCTSRPNLAGDEASENLVLNLNNCLQHFSTLKEGTSG